MSRILGLSVALAMLAASGQATQAATVTANLRVQATITNNCSVVGNTLDFGQVDLSNVGGQRPQTNINVTCTKNLVFQVGIDNGSNEKNGQRRMKSNTSIDFVDYELYKSLTGNDRFGDAIVTQRVTGLGNGTTPVIVPVYGQILAGQSEPAGQYVDNAVITVYF